MVKKTLCVRSLISSMRTTVAFLIFFTVFFGILILISYYIYIRGLQAIPEGSSLRSAYKIAFWFIALSFIGGRLLESYLPSAFSSLLIWVGSFWIAALVYFLIAIVSLDILRLINRFLPYYPDAIRHNYVQAKYIIALCISGCVGILLLAGHINAIIPRVVTLNLSVGKKAPGLKTLNIVAITDIHLGHIVGRNRFDQILDKLNKLNPDLVLLPGDIVDEDLAPVIKQNLGESLKGIHSKFGVYGVTGNHEYIGKIEKSVPYLSAHGIEMLRDQTIKIGDSFYLVGREDRSSSRYPPYHQRKTLQELMASVDKSLPIILMDHQPFGLEEASAQGVDLQISGHTHNGQFWPINYIVSGIYELAWGYKKIGDTHYYISDGVGTWGPPVRIASRPEIVQIRLAFK
jgi:uncharacterized protein